MDETSLSQIAAWSGGRLVGGAEGVVRRVVTDSRQVREGDLFVALVGARFDAHDFLREVLEHRVAGALVAEGSAGKVPEGLSCVVVEDTLRGLQRLAEEYRHTLPARVVGVTGSNGKTSTKEFTYAILRQRFRGWSTKGNLNNHIGVPMTLLAGGKADQMAVVEMGMNHRGEIAPLAKMAKPEVGIVTNVGVAHLEHLGSREAIAEEKGDLARAVEATGSVILSAADPFTPRIAGMTEASVLTAGIDCGDVQAVDVLVTEGGSRFGLLHEGFRVEVELGVPGRHMVQNAALAAAAGIAMGVSLPEAAEGLRGIRNLGGRLEPKTVAGLRFLDDSYNANPDSMEAALATLGRWPAAGRKVAVLGRMGELGAYAEEGHRRVGAAAAVNGIDWLITVGGEACWISEEAVQRGALRVDHVDSVQAAARMLRAEAEATDLVLLKGSRSAGMERVLEEVARG